MAKFRVSLPGAQLQDVRFVVELRSDAGPANRPPRGEFMATACVVPSCRNLQEAAYRLYARRYNLPLNQGLYRIAGHMSTHPWLDALEIEAKDEEAAREWWRQYCATVGRRDRQANAEAVFEEVKEVK